MIVHNSEPLFERVRGYLTSRSALWFWSVLVSSLLLIVDLTFNWRLIFIRGIAGLFFLLFVPGYCFLKALSLPRGEVDAVLQIVLSVCVSLIFVSVILLALNFSPIGLADLPFVVVLTLLSLSLSLIAIINETAA